MTAEQVAAAHYRQQRALAARTAAKAAALWSALPPTAIAAGWAVLATQLAAVLAAAQATAAAAAEGYLAAAAAAAGLVPRPAGQVNPAAFAGASDGRALPTLLYQPAIRTLVAVRAGASVEQAFALGAADLDMIVRTQVADAGRAADGAALAAHREFTGYVRMLQPPSCSRCVVLAGRRYRWNEGFLRHPRCDCRHIPAAEDTAEDLRTDPARYFDSLSEREQNRVFTTAGARAARDGADVSRVVNARRGMYTAGGKKLTREATTSRGTGRRVRLMPEQIYLEAQDDRDEAIRLLRLHGYIR